MQAQLTLPDTLAVMAQNGDAWALNELLHMHGGMLRKNAVNAAKSAFTMGVDDLFQEAVCETLLMLRSWRPNSGASFFSYAYGHLGLRLRRVKDSSDFIVSIQSHSGYKSRKTGGQSIPFSTGLFKPSEEGGESEDLLDEVEATNALEPDHEERDLERHLQTLIDRLPERERIVVRETHFGDADQYALAARFGVTRQAISQSYRNGIARLKRMAARSL